MDWQLTKVDDHRLKMSAGDAVVTPGLNYGSMLLLDGNHLAVLGADGITISKIHELPATYKRIAERADYYVAVVENPPAVDLLDKKTLATIRRIDLKQGRPIDLAIHPTLAISYVTFIAANLQANGRFVIVDEKTGKIRDAENYLGQWIEVDAAGRLGGGRHLQPHRGTGTVVHSGQRPRHSAATWRATSRGAATWRAADSRPATGRGRRSRGDGPRVGRRPPGLRPEG